MSYSYIILKKMNLGSVQITQVNYNTAVMKNELICYIYFKLLDIIHLNWTCKSNQICGVLQHYFFPYILRTSILHFTILLVAQRHEQVAVCHFVTLFCHIGSLKEIFPIKPETFENRTFLLRESHHILYKDICYYKLFTYINMIAILINGHHRCLCVFKCISWFTYVLKKEV